MEFLEKILWLTNTILKAGVDGITLKKIQDKSEESGVYENEKKLETRTFHNQKDKIQELFGINIKIRNGKRYYIENVEIMQKKGLLNWLANSASISSTLIEAKKLHHRILIENIPSAEKHLQDIIRAMQEKKLICIEYQSFQKDHPKESLLECYFLKEYGRRWYVYGKYPGEDKLKLYALDRIASVKFLDESYIFPDNYWPEIEVGTVFGVSLYDDIKPELITLKASKEKSKYLDSLALHPSQKKIEDGEDYSIYTLFVAPTIEFYKEILSQVEDIEIVHPPEVRNEMKEKIEKIAQLYQK